MSLFQLKNAQLSFGLAPLFHGAELSIDKREHIAIVGRNGVGKSTLLKLIAGEISLDAGELLFSSKLSVRLLSQRVPTSFRGSVYDIVVDGLGELGQHLKDYQRLHSLEELTADLLTELTDVQEAIEALDGWAISHKVETILSKMQLDALSEVSTLSGGLRRRVLLAQCLVSEPDILLLDEPTNHLDIEAIIWLENFLKSYSGTFIMVTHDRDFLSKTANRIIEIDRGKIFSYPGDHAQYLVKREQRLAIEDKEQALFDKRLAQEEVWVRQGIKARRTRNEGRVRALKKMRLQRAARREQLGNVKLNLTAETGGSKTVFEAKDVSFYRGEKCIVDNFSSLVMNGDKVGIIGSNGCGKTTLLRLLMNELTPTSGWVKQRDNLKVAYFDQHRSQLDESLSVLDNVAGGSQTVTINGESKHVIGYLQDFLFSPKRAQVPISQLSGGERNRLLLAKLFTQPANLLVMDEPTNDLDVESLELLESLLVEFPGTVLLVSHDRAFINNVVSSVWVYEGDGLINECVGGYDDYEAYKKRQLKHKQSPEKIVENKVSPKASTPKVEKKNKLSFNQQRELNALPEKIDALEQAISEMQQTMLEPDFYQQPKEDLKVFQVNLAEKEQALEAAFERWSELDS